jgi:hypothetical protein
MASVLTRNDDGSTKLVRTSVSTCTRRGSAPNRPSAPVLAGLPLLTVQTVCTGRACRSHGGPAVPGGPGDRTSNRP